MPHVTIKDVARLLVFAFSRSQCYSKPIKPLATKQKTQRSPGYEGTQLPPKPSFQWLVKRQLSGLSVQFLLMAQAPFYQESFLSIGSAVASAKCMRKPLSYFRRERSVSAAYFTPNGLQQACRWANLSHAKKPS